MSEIQTEREKIAQELADYLALPRLEPGEVTINDILKVSSLERQQIYRKLEEFVGRGMLTKRKVYEDKYEQNAYKRVAKASP